MITNNYNKSNSSNTKAVSKENSVCRIKTINSNFLGLEENKCQ